MDWHQSADQGLGISDLRNYHIMMWWYPHNGGYNDATRNGEKKNWPYVLYFCIMSNIVYIYLQANRLWRKKWQPTPGFLSGKSHGQRSMVSHSPWGRKESDTTEQLLFLSVDGYLGCFHVLANVNSAAVSIGVHVFFQIMVFLWVYAQEWDF